MIKVTAYNIPSGSHKGIEIGVYESLQLTEGSRAFGGVAILRNDDDLLIAELVPGKKWIVPPYGSGWDIVMSDAD